MVALQIEWTTDVVPAIYEAIEQLDEASKPEITGISTVADDCNAAVTLAVENGTLLASSATGISTVQLCTTDGRCLVSQSLGGAAKAYIPVVAAGGQVLVAKVVLSNGRSATYKIATR